MSQLALFRKPPRPRTALEKFTDNGYGFVMCMGQSGWYVEKFHNDQLYIRSLHADHGFYTLTLDEFYNPAGAHCGSGSYVKFIIEKHPIADQLDMRLVSKMGNSKTYYQNLRIKLNQ